MLLRIHVTERKGSLLIREPVFLVFVRKSGPVDM